MKHGDIAFALLVFLGIALGIYLERPEPPDTSLFGAQVALAPELAPLEGPNGTLSLGGTLRTNAGEPAVDAFLVLLRSDENAPEAEPLAHAYTDGHGRFSFQDLAPGSFRAVLTHPSAPPRTFALELLASGEVEWTLASPLPPLPVLPPIARVSLSGHIRLPEALEGTASIPRGEFEIVLVPEPETPLLAGATERRATTDAQGGFQLEEVVVASYRIQVLPPWARGGSWPILARSAWSAGGGPDAIELALAVGAILGEVQEASGRPLVGALVRVSALDALDPVGKPEIWPPQVTDAGGRFRVELLPPGRYQVHMRAGLAVRDVEVVVESGRSTVVPLGRMDHQVDEAPPGG